MFLIADLGNLSLILAVAVTFVEIDRDLFSMAILLPLIQGRLLSVTIEVMCTEYWLTAKFKLALENSVVRFSAVWK